MSTLDTVMEAWGNLMVVLFSVWVALSVVAELVHAWKSKTVSSLVNIYTVGLGLSIVGLFCVSVVYPETSASSLSWILVNRAIYFMALCLIGTHTCTRSVFLVLDLFAVGSEHPLRIRCARRAGTPLRYFLSFLCLMGILYFLTVAPYFVLWIWGG
jgi:hypothetical protein